MKEFLVLQGDILMLINVCSIRVLKDSLIQVNLACGTTYNYSYDSAAKRNDAYNKIAELIGLTVPIIGEDNEPI